MENLENEKNKDYYANIVNVHGSPYDIQFSFYRRTVKETINEKNKSNEFNDNFLTSIIMSYQHAKEFNIILTNVINNFEKDFGKIMTPKMKELEKKPLENNQ